MGYVASVPELESLSIVSSVIHPCHRSEEFQTCLESSPASHWALSRKRRCIDAAFALAVLLVGAIPMLVVAAVIRLTSPGRAIFSQQRVGMRGRLFRIYKFRSMTQQRDHHGPTLTRAGDNRVTAVGRFMRKFKIDELPQFYNVLRGDMSVVGPRPKLPQYSIMDNMQYRPGITGPATIVFRHEEEMMRSVAPQQLDDFYEQYIKPVKAHIDTCYMCHATAASDLRIVGQTLLGCLRPVGGRQAAPVVPHPAMVKRPVASLRVASDEASSSDSV